MTTVLRAPLRSRRDDVDPALTMARARALDVVGMGAATDERAERRLERFAAERDGTFAWAHDPADGAWLLGRLAGPLRLDESPEARAADLVHVRPCAWVEVDPVLVPPQVTYAFGRGGRNLQRIGTPGTAAATDRVWDALG